MKILEKIRWFRLVAFKGSESMIPEPHSASTASAFCEWQDRGRLPLIPRVLLTSLISAYLVAHGDSGMSVDMHYLHNNLHFLFLTMMLEKVPFTEGPIYR